MRKTKKDKTKVAVILVALCLVGVAALTGITLVLHKGKPKEAVADEQQTEEENTHLCIADPDEMVIPPAKKEVKVDETIGIKVTVTEDAELTQEIQETPTKGDSEKPSDPPAESVWQEESNPDKKPENTVIPEEKPDPTPTSSTDSRHGQIKDGKIFIDGFGWVDYNGGGGMGIYVEDMRENGNKVGIMD